MHAADACNRNQQLWVMTKATTAESSARTRELMNSLLFFNYTALAGDASALGKGMNCIFIPAVTGGVSGRTVLKYCSAVSIILCVKKKNIVLTAQNQSQDEKYLQF